MPDPVVTGITLDDNDIDNLNLNRRLQGSQELTGSFTMQSPKFVEFDTEYTINMEMGNDALILRGCYMKSFIPQHAGMWKVDFTARNIEYV